MTIDKELTTSELLESFPGLTRDQLYFWERSKWIKPMEAESTDGKRPRRKYSPGQVRKIEALWTAYQEGYTPQQAYERANVNEFLRHPQLSALLNASHEMVRSALYQDVETTLHQVAKSVAENLNSEVCSIFLLSESKTITWCLPHSRVERRVIDLRRLRSGVYPVVA